MIDQLLQQCHNKRILIAGFGREGKSSLRFIKTYLPDVTVAVADKNPECASALAAIDPKIPFFSGENYLNQIDNFDILLKSPGIKLEIPIPERLQISSQTDLFLSAFNAQTIGISGTKGKSTTAALIYHILVNAGLPALLTGNMGIPCFDIIDQITPDSIVVFELSAHQLEFVRHSPHLSVLLNIYEEHLDHFGGMVNYRNAKLKLVRFAKKTDFVVLHRALRQYVYGLDADIAYFPQDTDIDFPPTLDGVHNQLNIEAALLTAAHFNISKELALKALTTFKALPHRLEYLGQKAGVHFYNDSIATIPEAVIAALEAIPQTNFLILGGFDRGINYQSLISFLLVKPVNTVFYVGKAGHRIAEMLQHQNYSGQLIPIENLQQVFTHLKEAAEAGNTCLLSPAAASYDQFENFEQRGKLFKQLAEEFGK
ncbi:MAG: UDP-N-acetylmuramoyl-L-alanine--D-glutamate ligase [Bacteroidales bacterium]|jgi:UDP-N-acetylmuramoylalanine--D-glutamate ligase|nr:UDP-N-acetylmuramoyl-L-alanine--D-glutamate ligase [Bacteroidales bacterium]